MLFRGFIFWGAVTVLFLRLCLILAVGDLACLKDFPVFGRTYGLNRLETQLSFYVMLHALKWESQ